MPKTILVVDDDPGISRLIARELQRDGLLTASVSSGEEAVCWLEDNVAHLVLLDLKLPGLHGKDLIDHLDGFHDHLPFIITGEARFRGFFENVGVGTVELGADGCFTRGNDRFCSITGYSREELLQSFKRPGLCQRAHRSSHPRRHLPPPLLSQHLNHRKAHRPRTRNPAPLGPGKDNRAIAQELHISLKTVDTHRGHIKEKLGLKNDTELIHYAVRWVGEQV